MRKRNVLCFVIPCLLGSCGIYTKYQRPDTVTADGLFRDVPSEQADTASMASMPWRELFTDPKLQALIEQGLSRNADLNIARLKIEEAQASLTEARLAYLPSLALQADGTLRSFESSTTRTYNIGAAASWELDIFGRLTNAKRGAAEALAGQYDYMQAVQTQLVATIAGSYYTLLMLDEQLDISRRTLDTWESSVKTMEVLMRAGQTDETAVLQAKANRMTVEAAVLALGQSVREAENSLAVLLAIPPQAIGRGTLAGQDFPETLRTGLPVQLLANRPDVRQAERQLAVAYYATNSARSAFYPGITLSGTAGWTNSGGSGISNPGNWLLTAVGSLTQPLFQRGKLIAGLKTAKAQQEEAEIAFRQALLEAGKDVNDALTRWQTADKSLALSKQRVETLTETVRKTQLLMAHSGTTYLEVLTAQQALLSAELTLAQNRYDKINAVIQLYQSLGGGAY